MEAPKKIGKLRLALEHATGLACMGFFFWELPRPNGIHIGGLEEFPWRSATTVYVVPR